MLMVMIKGAGVSRLEHPIMVGVAADKSESGLTATTEELWSAE